MRWWLHLALPLVAAALSASCDDEPELVCGEEALHYERRIAPLFEEDRPSSCNQCHLSGIDLSLYDRGDPCDTMACMAQEGLVDLEQPEQSLILSWIDRAAPQSEGITEAVLAEEREGFLAWIELTAACGTCTTSETPCGEGAAESSCELAEELGFEEVVAADSGGCGDRDLEALFSSSFFSWRGRCAPCHQSGELDVPDAPQWVGSGDCEIASLTTLRNITQAGYIDLEDPSQSRWILKPLEESLGGIEHGGGAKIHSLDEDFYRLLLHFATRYADCRP